MRKCTLCAYEGTDEAPLFGVDDNAEEFIHAHCAVHSFRGMRDLINGFLHNPPAMMSVMPRVAEEAHVPEMVPLTHQGLRLVIDALRNEVSKVFELRAARQAYASEFPPHEGTDEPDVGSIHENIRKLKLVLQERYDEVGHCLLCDHHEHLRSCALYAIKPCPNCAKTNAVEEWGESGEYWWHCHDCDQDFDQE